MSARGLASEDRRLVSEVQRLATEVRRLSSGVHHLTSEVWWSINDLIHIDIDQCIDDSKYDKVVSLLTFMVIVFDSHASRMLLSIAGDPLYVIIAG